MIYLAALVIVIVFAGPFIASALSIALLLVTAFFVEYWLFIIVGAAVFFGSILLLAVFGDLKISTPKIRRPSSEEKLPDHKSSDTTVWTQQERDHENERRKILGMQSLEESESKG